MGQINGCVCICQVTIYFLLAFRLHLAVFKGNALLYLLHDFVVSQHLLQFSKYQKNLFSKPSQNYSMVVYVNFCKDIFMFEAAMASNIS